MVSTKDISFLPTEPGCYLFKDKGGKVIYVGKAKDIKKRVSSYFQKKDLDPKTHLLVSNIGDIDVITTHNEVEALLLENNLIKKYYPIYNIDLKDSRKYAYLLLHNNSLPWIEVARDRISKGEYYGPFVSGVMRKNILDIITRNFRILTRKPSPHLIKTIDPAAYNSSVDKARQILKGNTEELLKDLKKEMKECAEKKFYEHAITLRNQILALESLKEKQHMELTRSLDAHIINYKISGEEVYLLVFAIRKGVLEEKQSYSFPFYEDFFEDFILQYYNQSSIPQEIILPHEIDNSFKEYLSQKGERSVSLIVPQKGDKKELLDLVAHNINASFFVGSERITALQEILHLPSLPQTIECFDISHLGGTNTVAAMVCFVNGLPSKAHYRKFKIRSTDIGDDYQAMSEVVKRRYSGSLKSSLKNPDLIIIDGGLGQLSTASKVLKDLNLKIPIISLAKQFEEIYVPKKSDPLRIDKKNKGLQLLQSIRDEAHRFALSYQRHLRKRSIE